MEVKSVEQYMTHRGLDVECAVKMGISLETSQSEKRPGEWLRIPFYKGGEVVNNKYRSLNEKRFQQDTGGSQVFYNYDVITDVTLEDYPLVIVEGEFDALAAIQSGIPRVVSVPAGASIVQDLENSDKYNFYDDAANDIAAHVKEVIIAVDNDTNGKAMQQDLAILIGRAKCKYVTYPMKRSETEVRCKDLNDVLQEWGEYGVQKTFSDDNVKWFDVSGVHDIDGIPPQAERVSWAINPLGFDLKIRTRDFTVVTGIPNHGKSTFIDVLVFKLIKQYGLNVFFASMETHPVDDHLRKMQTWYHSKAIQHQSPEEQEEAKDWVRKHFQFMVVSEADEEAGISLESFKQRALTAIVRHGVKIIVLDPWNELDHKKRRDESTTEYVGRAIRELKAFAKRNNVHLIVAAHPTKMQRNRDTGELEPPGLYNIADSAKWYDKCDIGIIIHKCDKSTTMIDIQKTKHWDDIGRPATKYFFFDPERYEYSPAPSPEEKAEAFNEGKSKSKWKG